MLFYFILGALFMFICIPIMQNLLSIINAWAEYIVHKFALKIAKIKGQINDAIGEEEQEEQQEKLPIGFQSDCIGYQTSSEEEYEQGEDEQI